MQGASLSTKAESPSRFIRRRKTTFPVSSRPARLQTFLPRSIPRTAIFEKGLTRNKIYDRDDWQPDPLILDDRALVVSIKGKGLVVISGCAHAGIINTLKYAQQITGVTKVYAVLGGFHLAGRDFENRIKPTIEELTKINPELIAPSHCTGWRALFNIAQELPNAFVSNSVGNIYQLQGV